MPMAESKINTFLEDFEAHLSKPEDYLNPTPELRARCLAGVKNIFDILQEHCRDVEAAKASSSQGSKTRKKSVALTGPLPELYVEGFDLDQIWEQIQLVNEPMIAHLTKQVEKICQWDLEQMTSSGGGGGGNEVTVSDSESDGMDESESDGAEEVEEEHFSGDEELGSGEEEGEEIKKRTKLEGRRTVVDDRFFKLAEMEEFLEKVEREQKQEQGEDRGHI